MGVHLGGWVEPSLPPCLPYRPSCLLLFSLPWFALPPTLCLLLAPISPFAPTSAALLLHVPPCLHERWLLPAAACCCACLPAAFLLCSPYVPFAFFLCLCTTCCCMLHVLSFSVHALYVLPLPTCFPLPCFSLLLPIPYLPFIFIYTALPALRPTWHGTFSP